MGNVGKKKFLPLPGFKLWPLGCPACNQSLHWLWYPSSPALNKQMWYKLPNLCSFLSKKLQTVVIFFKSSNLKN
jgi:hypothetical protein